MTLLPRQYPALNDLGIPQQLRAALRQTSNHIYDIRDLTDKRIADINTTLANLQASLALYLSLDAIVDNETPMGAIDGVNTVYALAFVPTPDESLQLFLNGKLLRFGTDYMLFGSTVTYTVPPAPADWHRAYYRKTS